MGGDDWHLSRFLVVKVACDRFITSMRRQMSLDPLSPPLRGRREGSELDYHYPRCGPAKLNSLWFKPTWKRSYSIPHGYGCAAKVLEPWPYLRIKEAKTDTLFKSRIRKMTPYSWDPNNGYRAWQNTDLYKKYCLNTSADTSVLITTSFTLTSALMRFIFSWYNLGILHCQKEKKWYPV